MATDVKAKDASVPKDSPKDAPVARESTTLEKPTLADTVVPPEVVYGAIEIKFSGSFEVLGADKTIDPKTFVKVFEQTDSRSLLETCRAAELFLEQLPRKISLVQDRRREDALLAEAEKTRKERVDAFEKASAAEAKAPKKSTSTTPTSGPTAPVSPGSASTPAGTADTSTGAVKNGPLPDDFPGIVNLLEAGVATYAQLRKYSDDYTQIAGIGPATAQKITDALK